MSEFILNYVNRLGWQGLSQPFNQKYIDMTASYHAAAWAIEGSNHRTSSNALQYGRGMKSSPDYYVARAQKRHIAEGHDYFREHYHKHPHVRFVELGVGEGDASAAFFTTLQLARSTHITEYIGIDIAPSYLDLKQKDSGISKIRDVLPDTARVIPIQADFRKFKEIWAKHIRNLPATHTTVMMTGFTSGNDTRDNMKKLLSDIYDCLSPGEELIIDTDSTNNRTRLREGYCNPQIREYFFNALRHYTNVFRLEGLDIRKFDYVGRFDPKDHVFKTYLVNKGAEQNLIIPGTKRGITLGNREHIRAYYGKKSPITAWRELFEESGFKKMLYTLPHTERGAQTNEWHFQKPKPA